jgi:hypothetical protein
VAASRSRQTGLYCTDSECSPDSYESLNKQLIENIDEQSKGNHRPAPVATRLNPRRIARKCIALLVQEI